MTLAQTAPFLLISALCIIAPGPDNLTILSYGISEGRRAGICFGIGCAAGCLLHTFWAFAGVSALIAASATAFTIIKIAGAFYLFYLAYQALRSRGLSGVMQRVTAESKAASTTYFRRGFLANSLNPKVAMFFLAFLPQFTQPGDLSLPVQFLVLGVLFSLLTVILFSVLGYCSGALGTFLRKQSGAGLWLDRMTGCLFAFLGLRLLLAHGK